MSFSASPLVSVSTPASASTTASGGREAVSTPTGAAARHARDEILALPTALQQAGALTSFIDRPLIVVTAGSGAQRGWLATQDEMASLSTNSVHRVVEDATHNSLIAGVDAAASGQAILDVLASTRAGTALR